MRRLSAVLLTLTIAGSVAACGTSGRDLRQPVEGAVSPTRPTSSTTAPAVTAATTAPVLTITSSSFTPGGVIPAEFSCNGPSPSLSWSGVSADTTELALIVVDPEADGFVHWLVTGIKPVTASIPKGQAPLGAVQHPNSANRAGWLGPCPPEGATHTYNFILLALTEPAAIATGTATKDAVAQLQTKAAGRETILTGSFTGTGGTSDTAGPGSGSAVGTTPTSGP